MDKPLTQKKPPGGLLRVFLRIPILFYKIGFGFVFGKLFLMLTHKGRVSGLMRNVVLEVVGHDKNTGTYYIASGWGRQSNWYKNVLINQMVGVHVSTKKYEAIAKELDKEEAGKILFKHAKIYRGFFNIISRRFVGKTLEFSEESCMILAEFMPVVSLTPNYIIN